MIALLGSLTFAVIQGPVAGWASAWVIALFCVAAVSAAAFVAVERRSAEGPSPCSSCGSSAPARSPVPA